MKTLGNLRKVSVIDLGYNSLKMVQYRVQGDGAFKAYAQRGALTKIGEGLDKTMMFSDESIDRTIGVLKMFDEVNRIEKIDKVLAVATSAVRDAQNGAEFVRKAEVVTRMRFRVLSPEEEALYSYIGGVKATRFPTMLFFDLGGGSLELTYAEDFRVKRYLSLPLGALRMTESYGAEGGGYTKYDYDRLREDVVNQLPSRSSLDLRNDTVLVGVGGTVRALARYDQWTRRYPLNKVHNYSLKRKSVNAIHKLLRELSTDKIAQIESFGKDRSESIATGSLIVSLMMDKLAFDHLVVSTHGLRDGLLSEYLRDSRSYTHSDFTIELANNSLAAEKTVDPSGGLIHALSVEQLISPREEYILDEVVRKFMDLYLETRPESLFYAVVSEDSTLNQRDQVNAAIAMVRAKVPKMAKWFIETYSLVLKGFQRKSTYRMASVIQLIEILRLTGSIATIKRNGEAFVMEVTMKSEREFPELLLDKALSQLCDVTNTDIRALFLNGHGQELATFRRRDNK